MEQGIRDSGEGEGGQVVILNRETRVGLNAKMTFERHETGGHGYTEQRKFSVQRPLTSKEVTVAGAE